MQRGYHQKDQAWPKIVIIWSVPLSSGSEAGASCRARSWYLTSKGFVASCSVKPTRKDSIIRDHLNCAAQSLVVTGISAPDTKCPKVHRTSSFSVFNSKCKMTKEHEPIRCHGNTTKKEQTTIAHTLWHIHTHKRKPNILIKRVSERCSANKYRTVAFYFFSKASFVT